jgi:hypothetical protein
MSRAFSQFAPVLVVVLLTTSAVAQDAGPQAPDPSPWSFLAGTWTVDFPNGQAHEFTCELAKSKTCYVLASKIFQGTLGIDSSSDKPMLALGYHPGMGYSVGHWKRESDTVLSGGFWIIDNDGKKTDHTGRWEKIADGYKYTIDDKDVLHWRKRQAK